MAARTVTELFVAGDVEKRGPGASRVAGILSWWKLSVSAASEEIPTVARTLAAGSMFGSR